MNAEAIMTPGGLAAGFQGLVNAAMGIPGQIQQNRMQQNAQDMERTRMSMAFQNQQRDDAFRQQQFDAAQAQQGWQRQHAEDVFNLQLKQAADAQAHRQTMERHTAVMEGIAKSDAALRGKQFDETQREHSRRVADEAVKQRQGELSAAFKGVEPEEAPGWRKTVRETVPFLRDVVGADYQDVEAGRYYKSGEDYRAKQADYAKSRVASAKPSYSPQERERMTAHRRSYEAGLKEMGVLERNMAMYEAGSTERTAMETTLRDIQERVRAAAKALGMEDDDVPPKSKFAGMDMLGDTPDLQ